jgi:hypothetical protein
VLAVPLNLGLLGPVTPVRYLYLIIGIRRVLQKLTFVFQNVGLPLWSSGQCSWLQIQNSWVRFPALSDFLRSSGPGTGSGLESQEYGCRNPPR